MKSNIHKLKIREVDRGIFEFIKNGRKKVETRAATEKYRKIKKGDSLVFICGKDKLEKRVKGAKIFKNITMIIKKYKIKEIAPHIKTKKGLEEMYYSFPDYRQKIKEFGLIAFELD